MGISHNTVKAALEKDESPKYSRGGSRQLELLAFREILIQMLTVKKFKGSRIFNELKSKKYKGSRTVFYTYLSKVKPTKPAQQIRHSFNIGKYLSQSENGLCLFLYQLIQPLPDTRETSLSMNHQAVLEALEN